MKKILLPVTFVLMASPLIAEEEPVCEKCKVIRAYNAAHPENNYFYYDDYLKDQQKKQAQNTKPETQKSKDVAETTPKTPAPKK